MKENIKIKNFLKNLVKVENATSPNGHLISNQFIITGKDWTLFQSYESPIVLLKDSKVYLFENWDYSKTTGRYRNNFLRETKKETLKKLKSGEYIAVDFKI